MCVKSKLEKLRGHKVLLIMSHKLTFSLCVVCSEEMGNYSKNWGGHGGHISFSPKNHVVFLKSLLNFVSIFLMEHTSIHNTLYREYSNKGLKFKKTGILKFCNTGILEYWNTGILEYWNTFFLE